MGSVASCTWAAASDTSSDCGGCDVISQGIQRKLSAFLYAKPTQKCMHTVSSRVEVRGLIRPMNRVVLIVM